MKSDKRRVLAYGDSNIWGDIGLAADGSQLGRFPTEQRWPHILQRLLGEDYEVVQEGLCGRTAGDCDSRRYLDGRIGYEIALRSASPVDIVIIALGVNDLRQCYRLSSEKIVESLLWYSRYTGEYVSEQHSDSSFDSHVVYVGISQAPSLRQDDRSAEMIKEINNKILDSGLDIIIPNFSHGIDGVHYTIDDHKQLARMAYEKLKEVIQ